MNGKFEVFTDISGHHRWRLKASNGEIVATSEAYNTRAAAIASAGKVAIWAYNAPISQV